LEPVSAQRRPLLLLQVVVVVLLMVIVHSRVMRFVCARGDVCAGHPLS
jgi:hypothetical protein